MAINNNKVEEDPGKEEAVIIDELVWPEPFIRTVYDRMYGDFPAKNTVYTPYIL
jgi:hypothetical protein